VDQSKRGTQCIRKDKIDSDGGEWFIVWSTLGSRTAGERERERERGAYFPEIPPCQAGCLTGLTKKNLGIFTEAGCPSCHQNNSVRALKEKP